MPLNTPVISRLPNELQPLFNQNAHLWN